MKDERDERLSKLLRGLAPEPPAPRPDEEARIFAAIRREEARRLPAWKWGVPALAASAAAVILLFAQKTTVPVTDGDLEDYLSQTIGAQYAEEEADSALTESGSRLLALADVVAEN